jgi:hypothetical protein
MSPMQLIRRFTIRTRMLGAIGMVLFLLVLLGSAGLLGLHHVSGVGEQFVAQTHADTLRLAALRTALGDVRRFEKDLLINYDDEQKQAGYRAKWDKAVEAARSGARGLAGAQQPERAAMAARIDELLASYSAKAQPVLRQLQVGGFNDAPVANKAMDAAKRHAHDAEAQLDALLAVLEAETSANNEARGAATTAAYWVFALAVACAVVLVVPLTLINMRSICTPVAEAEALAQRLSLIHI